MSVMIIKPNRAAIFWFSTLVYFRDLCGLSPRDGVTGAIFVAALLAFLSGVYEQDPWKSFIIHMNENNIIKLGWGEVIFSLPHTHP